MVNSQVLLINVVFMVHVIFCLRNENSGRPLNY